MGSLEQKGPLPPVPRIDVGVFVYRAFLWASRTEVYTALDRMIGKGRVRVVPQEGRTLPFYALPLPSAYAHAASPSPAT